MHRREKQTTSEKRQGAEQRRQRRERARTQMGRMLYDRDQTRYLLGNVSESTIRRLEHRNKLHPVRPSGSPIGKVFYSHDDIVAIARGEA